MFSWFVLPFNVWLLTFWPFFYFSYFSKIAMIFTDKSKGENVTILHQFSTEGVTVSKMLEVYCLKNILVKATAEHWEIVRDFVCYCYPPGFQPSWNKKNKINKYNGYAPDKDLISPCDHVHDKMSDLPDLFRVVDTAIKKRPKWHLERQASIPTWPSRRSKLEGPCTLVHKPRSSMIGFT